jgi:mannan endo-1,4-beta-mannosidase
MRLLFVPLCFIILSIFNGNLLFSQGFTVSGTQLLDANGKEFIIRGVNNPHIWYQKKSFRSLAKIARLKTNCIRIVWQTTGKPYQLEKIIKRCIKLEIIPMVELHDATGDPKTEKLLNIIAYYTDSLIKKVLIKYEKYILINLANEWGDYFVTAEYWKTSYIQAIDKIRNAGIKTTLVIDAPAWGQNLQPILQYGKDLLNYDPQKNLLFSIHMYGSWNNPDTIEAELQKAYNLPLPLIVGEFGYNYDGGNNNLKCKADHTVILRKCQELGYGYMPWSWAGNDKKNAWLDLSDWKNLTWWGKEVFLGKNGICETAKKASVFPY